MMEIEFEKSDKLLETMRENMILYTQDESWNRQLMPYIADLLSDKKLTSNELAELVVPAITNIIKARNLRLILDIALQHSLPNVVSSLVRLELRNQVKSAIVAEAKKLNTAASV